MKLYITQFWNVEKSLRYGRSVQLTEPVCAEIVSKRGDWGGDGKRKARLLERSRNLRHGTECLIENGLEIPVIRTSIFTEKNPTSTAWRAQSAENARTAMHTSVRVLWRWRRMAVSGQLYRVAECLSYKDITLAHRNPPPSPQKWDTCENPVQNFRRAAPSFRVTF